MKLVVIGGHSRNIGKTSLAAAIIHATRDLGWTAFKLTQYGHGICSSEGNTCECAPQDPAHPLAITREDHRDARTDTSRFLAAGAHDAYWVRTPEGRLAEALPEIRRLVAGKQYVIMESNSILRFLRPDLYLVVLDPATADFKPSARQQLDRADAFVSPAASLPHPVWQNVPEVLLGRRPLFLARPPDYLPPELLPFVRARLTA
jgi:hypothetical protein